MAVPKKRTSKTKKRIRKSIWKAKASKTALQAFSLAKSILKNKTKSFCYISETKSDPTSNN